MWWRRGRTFGLSTFCKIYKIVGGNSVSEMATKRHLGNGDCQKAKKPAFWDAGLKAAIDDPKLHVFADDKIVIIKDKYPKARFHYLVLPKESFPNLKSLTREQISLLKHMAREGHSLVDKLSTKLTFRYGYHAIPSMSHVHLHVISQDFDSPSLKTKKHWNSFTTEYFIDSSEIIRMLEEDGKIQVDTSKYQDILKQDLRCHICSTPMKTIPALKTHLKTHLTE